MGFFDDEDPGRTLDWVIAGFLVLFTLYMIWQIVRAGRFW